LEEAEDTMSRSYTATEELPTQTLIPASDAEICTIDELIRRRAAVLKDAPLIGYPNEGVTDYEDHSAFAVDKYADAAAEALQRRGLKRVVSTRNAQPVLALTLSHRTPPLTRPLSLAFLPIPACPSSSRS
jgi:hypothetical protein